MNDPIVAPVDETKTSHLRTHADYDVLNSLLQGHMDLLGAHPAPSRLPPSRTHTQSRTPEPWETRDPGDGSTDPVEAQTEVAVRGSATRSGDLSLTLGCRHPSGQGARAGSQTHHDWRLTPAVRGRRTTHRRPAPPAGTTRRVCSVTVDDSGGPAGTN